MWFLASGKVWVLGQLKQVVINEEDVTGLNSEPLGLVCAQNPTEHSVFHAWMSSVDI